VPGGTGEPAATSEDGAGCGPGTGSDDEEEVDVSSDDGLDEGAVEADAAAFDAPSAAQREVRDLLRAAAAPDLAMPDDVVARLDAALAAARPATGVASLARRRQRARRVNRVLAAAAGVVVLGGGVVVAQHVSLPGGGASSSSAGSAAGGPARDLADSRQTAAPDAATAGTGPVVLASGADYGDPAALAAGATAVAAAASAPSAGPGRTTLSAPQDATGAQPDPAVAQALSCAQALGVDPSRVVGVDLAQWRGTPAAVVVVPAGDGAVQVTVLARDCVPGAAALAEQTVATPAP